MHPYPPEYPRDLTYVARETTVKLVFIQLEEPLKYLQHFIASSTRRESCSYYDVFCKHLNIVQAYICGTAYLVENTGNDAERVITTILDATNKDKIVNDRVKEGLQGIFSSTLQYLDTQCDRQVVKALIAEITSAKFTAELQGLSSRQGTTSAKKALLAGLEVYREIRPTSQCVQSDLTYQQQHSLTERIVATRKAKQIKIVAKGRGRKLKTDHFPEAHEYAFGEVDVESGGGGLQAHPRLTIETMYRTCDSITTMRKARELVLSLASPGFTISLSTCYNYTTGRAALKQNDTMLAKG